MTVRIVPRVFWLRSAFAAEGLGQLDLGCNAMHVHVRAVAPHGVSFLVYMHRFVPLVQLCCRMKFEKINCSPLKRSHLGKKSFHSSSTSSFPIQNKDCSKTSSI